MDKISVIVAVYNVEKYLKECLESLQQQTYSNFEVIIVNDGSTDGSEAVIKPFLKDKRFRTFKKENGGLSSTRNFGMKKAQGDYISFIDGDDFVNGDYLEKLHRAIIINKTDVAACGFTRDYPNDIHDNPVSEMDMTLFRYPAAWNKMYICKLLKQNNIEFPLGRWYEDLCFTTKVLLIGNFCVINDLLHHYRQNDKSIMHTYDDRIFDMYAIIDEVEEFAIKNNVMESKKKELEFMNIYHVLIGTIFRASFHKDFSVAMVQKIVHYVMDKYPDWYYNEYIKSECSIPFQIFLNFVWHEKYGILCFFLKHFHQFANL